MAEFLVVSEQDIRKKIDLNGMSLSGSEDQIRAVLEKMGVDFGRSTFVYGETPNRQWSNNRNAFYPAVTDSVPTAPGSTAIPYPSAVVEPSQGQKDIAALKAELAELKELRAQIAEEKALIATPPDKAASAKPYATTAPAPKKS